MSEAIDSIEAHIRETRKDLDVNLHALETKVKSLADWRRYLGRKPLIGLGALVGGVLLLNWIRKPKRRKWFQAA